MTYYKSRLLGSIALTVFVFFFLPPIAHSQAEDVSTLIQEMRDKDPLVRQGAARALGIIGDTRAVDPLIATLRDGNRHVQGDAAEALRKITGEDFGGDHEKWQDWWERSKRE
jgi:HEAT repeat protein